MRNEGMKSSSEIIEDYLPLVRRVVGSVLTDSVEVDDVVQDSLVKIFMALKSYDPDRASLATWISRIAYRTALNACRAISRRPTSISQYPKADCEDEGTDEYEDDIILLMRAIDELGGEDRSLLHLYYFEALPLADISFILDVNSRTLATRLFRLRGALAEKISKMKNL